MKGTASKIVMATNKTKGFYFALLQINRNQNECKKSAKWTANDDDDIRKMAKIEDK